MKFYSNKSNSCYIDSLLSIIFLADMGVFAKSILLANITRTTYTPSVVSSDSIVNDVKRFARDVRIIMYQLFTDADRKRHSTDLVRVLSRANRAFTLGSMANPAELYDLLASLFPRLLVQYNRKESDGVFARQQCLFDMTDVRDVRVRLRSWPSHLVFSNGGIERYTTRKNLINWSEKGFGLTLYGNMYRLVGVIVHVNMCHYVSYFQIKQGEPFYYYDDMNGDPVIVNELPTNGVFQDVHKQQPAMYFYVKN